MKAQLSLNLALEDGRSLSTVKPVALAFAWEPPTPTQLETLRMRTVNMLAQATANAAALSPAESTLMEMLIANSETSASITRDQALAALLQRQRDGSYRFREVMHLVFTRWRQDPAVIAFYREALATRGPAAIADLAAFTLGIWDDSFLEPVIRLVETSAAPSGSRTFPDSDALSYGIRFLDRNYSSWRQDASVPPRLSKAVREMHSGLKVQSVGAFYNFVVLLAETHDRKMISFLRQYLTDKTIDQYTSLSANMPAGRTPMRYSELAANGISMLLGEPIMFDPYQRARAPAQGPFPEWTEWDKRIEALQRRLDAMPEP